MNLNIEFTIGFIDIAKEYPWIIQRKLHRIKTKLNKYTSGNNIGIDPIYTIEREDLLFLEAKKIESEHSDSIEIIIHNVYPEFTENEMNEAVAYEPYFINRYCIDYDEESNNEDGECCRECDTIEFRKSIEIQPKKINKDKYTTFVLEYNHGVFFVSPIMYEYLNENGIESSNFTSAHTKRKKCVAYRIYNEKLLGINEYKDKSYSESITCNNCGKTYKNLIVEDEYIDKYLSKEGLDKLEDVILTNEYFGDNRKVIVSKRVYKLIKEKDSKSLFLPIYLYEK